MLLSTHIQLTTGLSLIHGIQNLTIQIPNCSVIEMPDGTRPIAPGGSTIRVESGSRKPVYHEEPTLPKNHVMTKVDEAFTLPDGGVLKAFVESGTIINGLEIGDDHALVMELKPGTVVTFGV